MALHQIGDQPLCEPMMGQFNMYVLPGFSELKVHMSLLA